MRPPYSLELFAVFAAYRDGCRGVSLNCLPPRDGRSRFLLPFVRAYEEHRLMCKARTLSLIPNVAKAVKTASPIHPNQDDESCDALRRTAFGLHLIASGI